MDEKFDVAIVGGGIVGLAHAWAAAKKGFKTVIFERASEADGASVRNFGMIWPIGQTSGEAYEIALRSRELWLELGAKGVLEVEECGSIHLAHHADELAVLKEFLALKTHEASWITANEIEKKTTLANPDGLLGGMFSPTELRVNPRTASRLISRFLTDQLDVTFKFSSPIVQIVDDELTTADQSRIKAERIVVCSGSDLKTLFPDEFEKSGLKLCKLQMLKTAAQENHDLNRNAHLAGGLTLRHYRSFESCTALPKLRERIASETPLLDQFGIHVMASQFPNGEIVLGDSHEYGDEITPFDKSLIDNLIIDELRKILSIQDWTIAERWHGIYAKHPEELVFEKKVSPQVDLFVGTGGAGMTLSFGLADRYWNSI